MSQRNHIELNIIYYIEELFINPEIKPFYFNKAIMKDRHKNILGNMLSQLATRYFWDKISDTNLKYLKFITKITRHNYHIHNVNKDR